MAADKKLDNTGKILYVNCMENQKEIVIFSFTRTGNRLNRQVQEKLAGCGYLCEGYTAARLEEPEGLKALDADLRTWIGGHWGRKTFLFIGAAGIAVRYIAPWVRDKYTDSAVLVMDERGQYVIPLLSGHMGGAVETARVIEREVHARAVVTTATDVQGKFAVDVFARGNHLRITDRHLAKKISAAVLEGEPVGFFSELPVADPLPPGLVWCGSMEELAACAYGIAVAAEAEKETEAGRERILVLSPCGPFSIVVGIGCRRGTPKQQIRESLGKLLGEYGLRPEDVGKMASIDLKKDEPGILAFAKEYQIPFYTYPASKLREVPGEMAGSAFVLETTGVDNVCERAARCCAPGGRLLQPKRSVGGITFALVEEQAVLTFRESR